MRDAAAERPVDDAEEAKMEDDSADGAEGNDGAEAEENDVSCEEDEISDIGEFDAEGNDGESEEDDALPAFASIDTATPAGWSVDSLVPDDLGKKLIGRQALFRWKHVGWVLGIFRQRYTGNRASTKKGGPRNFKIESEGLLMDVNISLDEYFDLVNQEHGNAPHFVFCRNLSRLSH